MFTIAMLCIIGFLSVTAIILSVKLDDERAENVRLKFALFDQVSPIKVETMEFDVDIDADLGGGFTIREVLDTALANLDQPIAYALTDKGWGRV